jgi:hypothetical protein
VRKRLPRIKFGVRRIDDALEAWALSLEYAAGLTATPPLLLTPTPGGPVISLNEQPRMIARLTANSGSGAYTFSEAYATASGAFALVPSGRTGTAREWNGNDTIPLTSPDKHVEIRWISEVEEWRFQAGSCS